MKKKIISIKFEIPGYSDDCHDYYSEQSLLDADLIVFEPESYYSDIGKSSFDETDSFKLKENDKRWYREINTALEYGKTIFVILKKFQIASIHTGQKEFKGARTINYVEDYNNYKFLPVDLPHINARGGSEIIFTGHAAFAIFWKEFKSYLKFESYLDGKIKIPVFITKTGERPVGGVFKIGKGNLVLLPLVTYNREKFIKEDKEKKKEYWTKEAITFGNRFVASLFEIDKALKSQVAKTPPPNWVEEPVYSSNEELLIISEIEKVSTNIEKLNIKRGTLTEDLLKAKQLKDLLFETGKALEQAVILAMQILGYSAENYNDGSLELDQVILSPEGQRYIGECEGKDSNAVNIDKFRQLEENIQSDLQREDVESPAIGILFGNGFRLTKPDDRAEQFTVKCLNSAKRGTILIRTADLYKVVKYLKENNNPEYASACRSAISSSVGSIVTFPKAPEIKAEKNKAPELKPVV